MAFPEDSRAAFGADDRVIGVFEDGDAVADAQSQRPARTAFADHHADDRRRQPRHQEHRLGNHLRLAALLGADARISPAGVDQTDDRHVELGGQPHLGHGLAVALGMGVAEIAEVFSLNVLPF